MLTRWEVWNDYNFALFFVIGCVMVGCYQPRRKYFWARAILPALLLLVYVPLIQDYGDAFMDALNLGTFPIYFGQYLIVLIGMYFCFECKWMAAFFCVTTAYCLQHFAQRLWSIVYETFLKSVSSDVLMVLIPCLIVTAVYTIYYFVLVKQNKPALCEIEVERIPQFFVGLFGILVTCLVDASMMKVLFQIGMPEPVGVLTFTLSALIGLITLLFEFNLLSRWRMQEDMKYLQLQMQEERRQYQHEKESIDMINIKCHDIRHQLRMMEGQMNSEAVKELVDTIQVYDATIKTGNEAVDVVMKKYGLYCQTRKIKLTCMLDGRKLTIFQPHELYALFGNILENAMNAVEKLEDERRIISISSMVCAGFLNISFTNFFDHELEMEEGLPISRKKDHGFGLRSVRMLVEKYGGRVNVNVSDDTFTLNLFLPVQDHSGLSGG